MPNWQSLTTREIATQLLSAEAHDAATDFELVAEQPPEFVEVTTRYVIHEALGRGGAAVVFRARDELLNRDVAMKLLHQACLKQPYYKQLFELEAKIICSLSHPAIPQVYDFGHLADGRPFFTMRIIDGWTLQQLIESRPPTHRAELLQNLVVAINALAYTHSKGIVHLDFKPANIMVGSFGEVHVMDWGNACSVSSFSPCPCQARHAETDFSKSQSHIGGTLGFMAPEHVSNRPITTRFDVFAIGASLCHVLTGWPIYDAENFNDLYQQSLRCKPTEAYARLEQSGFDRSIVELTKACLSRDPADRPADAGVVARELARYHDSALQQYASDMQRFFEISLDLFCIADLHGYFRRINSNFTRVLGIPEADLLGQPFIEFVHPEDRPQTIAQIAVLAEGKPVVRFRNRYRTASGDYVPLEWTSKSIPAEGMIFAVARVIDGDDSQTLPLNGAPSP